MKVNIEQAKAGDDKTEEITSFIPLISDHALIYNSHNFDVYDAEFCITFYIFNS